MISILKDYYEEGWITGTFLLICIGLVCYLMGWL
jgi:hypothetical protein